MAKAPREVTVVVEQLSADGLGQARLDDKPLHIRGALPGETVQARVLKRRKGVLFADALSVVGKPNLDRVSSACQLFPRCGGCNMHHIGYTKQLTLKQSHLAAALEKNRVVPKRWREPTSAVRLGYRRKARLGVRKLGDQVLVGFRESFSNRVARLTECMVLTPELSRLITPLKSLIARLSIAESVPQIEFAQGDDMVAMMLRHLAPLSLSDRTLVGQFQAEHGIIVLLQAKGYDSLVTLDGGPIPLLGYRLLQDGLFMQFDPRQFTQVNLPMNQALITDVKAYLGAISGKRVVDLFCGIGNFSLPMARSGARVWGYEVDETAVEQAWHNAKLNGLTATVHFSSGDLYAATADSGIDLPAADALVLDPPRSGAGPNLERWMAASGCHELVYVSCNPASFAQDARRICDQGFCLQEVSIYDMFPHTAHIETLGYFVRAH